MKEAYCICGFCNCDNDLQNYDVDVFVCDACVSQCYVARGVEVSA